MGERGWRIVAVVVAVGVLLALGRFLVELSGGEGPTRVTSSASSLSVADAVSRHLTRPVPVTGFAFVEDGALRLCNGREPGDPPRCVGPFLDVTGIDPSRLPLERAEPPSEVSWSPEPVVLAGTVRAGRLDAEEILS